MELRHLRCFIAVAEELHFRRAAERLHVAQPAVSEQVRKLEQELGVRLFDRTQRRVSLTPAGLAMLEEARQVLRQADAAQQAARNATERTTMRLRIGYLPDALPGRVPLALRHLGTTSPRIQIRLETGPALRLIHAVRAQRLDAVVTSLPAPTGGLRATPLDEQRMMAVLPVSHAHAREPEVELERLAPSRLVTLPREVNPALHNAVVSACHTAGLCPVFVDIGSPRAEDVLLAVAAGTGMALLPESVAERYMLRGIRFVPLAGASPAFRTAVLTHPEAQDLATAAFLRSLAIVGRSAGADDEPTPAVTIAA